VTADEAVCPKTRAFCDMIVKNILDEIERTKDMPLP